MQNQHPASVNSVESNNAFSSNFVQIQPNSILNQRQNMTASNVMQQRNSLPVIALQGGNVQQYIPVPQGTAGPYLRFQVANQTGGLSYVPIPANGIRGAAVQQNVSNNNRTFIPIRPQIATPQPTHMQSTNLGSHFLIDNNSLKFKQLTTPYDSNTLLANGGSFVGTVSRAEATLNTSVSAPSVEKAKPVQQFIIVTSPLKTDSVLSYIQTPTNTQKSNQFSSSSNVKEALQPASATLLGTLNAAGSLTPQKTLVKMQANLTQENLQQLFSPNTLQQYCSPTKSVQPTFAETKLATTPVVMVSSYQKQQVLAPKTSQAIPLQQATMLVPISVAGNVLTLNQLSAQPNVHKDHPQPQMIRQPNIAEQQQASSLQNAPRYFIQVSPDKAGQYVLQPALQTSSPQPNAFYNRTDTQRNKTEPRKTKSPVKSKTSSSASVGGKKNGRKPCNCTKSQCLKLYCECFANGEFCQNCNCRLCLNNIENEAERSKAIKVCLERNPSAFHPKIGKGRIKGDTERRHTKGCNCKRSGCLKNYCECYEAKILCSSLCRCSGCKNFEESADRKTLMHLADAAEERVMLQNAAKTKLASQMCIVKTKSISSGSRSKLPHNFITDDVIKATCEVMLARAQEVELTQSPVSAERMILDEFSQCLNRIILKSQRAGDGNR